MTKHTGEYLEWTFHCRVITFKVSGKTGKGLGENTRDKRDGRDFGKKRSDANTERKASGRKHGNVMHNTNSVQPETRRLACEPCAGADRQSRTGQCLIPSQSPGVAKGSALTP